MQGRQPDAAHSQGDQRGVPSPQDTLIAEVRNKLDPNRFDPIAEGVLDVKRHYVTSNGTTIDLTRTWWNDDHFDRVWGGWKVKVWPPGSLRVGNTTAPVEQRSIEPQDFLIRDSKGSEAEPFPTDTAIYLTELLRDAQELSPYDKSTANSNPDPFPPHTPPHQ